MAKSSKTKTPVKKAAPKTAPKPAAKETKAPAKKAAGVETKKNSVPAAKPAANKAAAAKADALRQGVLERRIKPIGFTLDEVREVAKTNTTLLSEKETAKREKAKEQQRQHELEAKLKKAAQPHHVKQASLADILGYNPAKQKAPTHLDPNKVEAKFQRYYKLLIQLRDHVRTGLDTHTEETLKRSSKEDSGELSGYGTHMADAGTDTFDRDFALSLVSNEQEALSEIEAAIQRIHDGTYGVCETTGKPISKERLLAVPFARYSVESQAEMEKYRRRTSSRGGIFGETDEAGVREDSGDSEE